MDYSYIFPDLTDELEHVRVIHHTTNGEYPVHVRVDDKQLMNTNMEKMPSLAADLVDLAGAIYTSDWLSPRKDRRTYDIHISLPLRNSDIFNRDSTLTCLQSLLWNYSKDRWHFEFKPRCKPGRLVETCRKLNLSGLNNSVEVALWSGGLDSLAGLYNRIINETSAEFILFGSGSNNFIKGKQQEIADAVRQNFLYRIRLIQLPIEFGYPDKHKPPTNDLFRTRGFTFKLLGAVCAYLEGQRTLHIYENGFGAINLPYRLSEIGRDHTRSVHPISLLGMGDFVSKVLEVSFVCDNPFLFWTKAQMCEVLVKEKATNLIFETVTCDGRHRQAGQPSQCGYCSSCLLRRVALAAAQIEDQTQYVITHGTQPSKKSYKDHFTAMQFQVEKLQSILNSKHPWQKILDRYPSLREIVVRLSEREDIDRQIIENKLLQLYRRHVEEWTNAQDMLKREQISPPEGMEYRQLPLAW